MGNIATTVFDADGRVLASVNANGCRTSQVYDAAGQTFAVVDARGNRNSLPGMRPDDKPERSTRWEIL